MGSRENTAHLGLREKPGTAPEEDVWGSKGTGEEAEGIAEDFLSCAEELIYSLGLREHLPGVH